MEVTEGLQLKPNEYYVAVGHEGYKDFDYGITPHMFSPVQQQKK